MNKKDFEADLRTQIDSLDKSKQPERDLWAGIEIALADEASPNEISQQTQRSDKPKIYAIAASVAFVGALTWFGMQQSDPQIGGDELIAALSTQHQAQKDALLVKFQDQPALTENWQKQLEELDEAATAIKAALKQDPNNLALLKMLQSVHQQQIDLIERVHSPKWRQI
ncbi:MAG: hypothetical protein Alis3KO_29770 [Aliiglaciecola sp.]|uniref:hypothetical protein n=1 Tax=Aliiglaciecola sp. M165 TaxID=2593649 RepID=UPI00117CC90B|nr:hypothetical protein [Aliiglaciecola sp. M165]TRY33825.1 hypothetical protein FM019_00770 [Aliiglaciecola sp. M165]